MRPVEASLGAARSAAVYARRERGRTVFIVCVMLGFIIPLIALPAAAFGQ